VSLFSEAVSAKDGPPLRGIKGNGRFTPAGCTFDTHGDLLALAVGGSKGGLHTIILRFFTGLAAFRRIRQAFLLEE